MGAGRGEGRQMEEDEGHLSQKLLIVGELALGYHNVEVIGTPGKVIWGIGGVQEGMGEEEVKEAIADSPLQGVFYCNWSSC